ncbi:MAG: hypothetical protein Q8R31_07540 [Candidatus Omnitrophota bacterium]|nr:hypothetical protein [Candidatus Omnitrophota bacterium]
MLSIKRGQALFSIRPTIASLMNDADKAEDFGPVNERFLRKELNQSAGLPVSQSSR